MLGYDAHADPHLKQTSKCRAHAGYEVKNIMVDNIEKVLERGEKIELLVDKTDNLRFQVRSDLVM